MKKGLTGLRRFLEMAAWLMILALLLVMAGAALMMTAQLRAPEKVYYVFSGAVGNVLLALLLLAVVWALWRLLLRRRRLMGVMALLWTAVTACVLVGMGTAQEVDFLYVCQAAKSFAVGDYSPMTGYYFNEYSYQLGTVLLLEGVVRLLPGVNVELVMQAVNAVLSMGSALMLAALGRLVFEEKSVHAAAMALYMLCLPMAVYCIHVYGTLPMVFLSSAAMLCFALYIKKRRSLYGFAYALCIALAYMIKPNGAVALLAMMICALLYGMEHGDWRLLGFAVLSAVLAVLLARFAVWQYEWRSGVTLREDVSMLARLVMGLQDGPRGAGWYNGYTEQFFDSAVTMQQEKAIAMQDLTARIGELKEDPVRAAIFAVQKALSQWQEPTYGTLLYGNYCQQTGMLAGAAQALFGEESALRMALEHVMKGWQAALYVLCSIGAIVCIRKKRGAAALVLPVAVLGGFLYHMLFEAKSQYIYVYALYLVPLAGYGLCAVQGWICNRTRKI